MFEYKLVRAVINDGSDLSFARNGLTIITGANSSGKSQLLRDILTLWQGIIGRGSGIVIDKLELDRTFMADEFWEWVGNTYGIIDRGDDTFMVGGIHTNTQTGRQILSRKDDYAKAQWIAPLIIQILRTEHRLELSNAADRINLGIDSPTHFVHKLLLDNAAYIKIQQEVARLFDIDFVIDAVGSKGIEMYVGIKPIPPGGNEAHPDYSMAVRENMTPLRLAGDGIRSFIVTLASVLVEAQPVVLIDEPDVFLHPPQARRLGKLLSEIAAERDRQVVVATHSGAFIRGAMQSQSRIAVARIGRSGWTGDATRNQITALTHNEVREFWNKPILRSASALEGLFHHGVIVTEADADSRFYEAVYQKVERDSIEQRGLDLYFVHGGGKGELKTFAESYRRLRIPVSVIADFDVLNNEETMAALVGSLGHDWTAYAKKYRIVASGLAEAGAIHSKSKVLEVIEKFVDYYKDAECVEVPGKWRRNVARALSGSMTWSAAKKYGIMKLSGQQHEQAELLLTQLETIGLFIVPNGEMESWDRGLPGKEQGWAIHAINKIEMETGSFAQAKAFVSRIVNYLSQ